MSQRRTYFTTRDLLMIAALAALGGVVSTYVNAIGDWNGVALAELLDKAGAAEYVSITAVAGDGYAIEISRDELQDAIVALKEDGEWIAEADPDHGPIRLVCPHTPANRWVFQLMELQVNAEAAGVPEDAAFRITGNVETEVGWTEEKIRSIQGCGGDPGQVAWQASKVSKSYKTK